MPRSFVEQALARCSVTGSKLWFNCNPDHPYHWFYREWICKAQEKHALYLHFTMADNPSLSKEVRQRYERLYSGIFYERFVLGKWTVSGGLVYPMFQEHCHVTETAPACDRYVVSCDYGTVNPCSMGLWGHCAGIWYRIKEYYYDARKQQYNRTDEEHYKGLLELTSGYPVEQVVVDPSAASFIACIRRHAQFRVLPADNQVLEGIQLVSELLNQQKLRICAGCQDILREFGLYCWDESAMRDAPKKNTTTPWTTCGILPVPFWVAIRSGTLWRWRQNDEKGGTQTWDFFAKNNPCTAAAWYRLCHALMRRCRTRNRTMHPASSIRLCAAAYRFWMLPSTKSFG